MTAHRTSAALTGLVLAALVAASSLAASAPQGSTTTSGAPARTQVRGVSALPSLAEAGRTALPTNAIVSKSDTFLVLSHGFDDLAGACQDRGWVGEDRTSQLYAHVVTDKTVNQVFFTGLAPVSGTDNLTGNVATTRIWGSYAVATTDSGVVVFADEDVTHRLFAVYPGQSAIRTYGVWPGATGKVADLAYNGATHRMIACGAILTGLYAFAGNGENPALLGGTGTVTADTTLLAARIEPRGLAVDPLGNIYFAEYNTNRVRVARVDGRVVTIAGTGMEGFGGDGGPATAALLFKPIDVALDPSGTALYIAENGNNRIRVVQLATGIISTFYGDGTMAMLGRPQSIACSGGTLWITQGMALVSRLAGGVLTTVAGGGGSYGPAAGGSDALQQTLGSPQGVAADGTGGVYFTDLGLRLAFHLDAGGALSAVAGVPAPIAMGDRSLWFGADMASHPAEVADWVRTSGYGNGWSQRLTSPPFSSTAHPGAVLHFDGSIDLGTTGPISINSVNEWVQVQGLDLSGNWTSLHARVVLVGGADGLLFSAFIGRGRFKAEVRLGQDGNEYFYPAAMTRLRIIVQTETSGSSEDGLGPDAPDGALVVDNLTLKDGDLDVLPPTDFEDGTTGPWTLSAVNGGYVASGMVPFWYRDFAAAATDVALQKGFDFTDPGCVWTFLAAGDTVNQRGVYARLTSPWFARGSRGHPAPRRLLGQARHR